MSTENFNPPLLTHIVIHSKPHGSDENVNYHATIKPGFELKYQPSECRWILDNQMTYHLDFQYWSSITTGIYPDDWIYKYFDVVPAESCLPPVIYTPPYPTFTTANLFLNLNYVRSKNLFCDEIYIYNNKIYNDEILYSARLTDFIQQKGVRFGELALAEGIAYYWYIETETCYIVYPSGDTYWIVAVKNRNHDRNVMPLRDFEEEDNKNYFDVPLLSYFHLSEYVGESEDDNDVEDVVEDESIFTCTHVMRT